MIVVNTVFQKVIISFDVTGFSFNGSSPSSVCDVLMVRDKALLRQYDVDLGSTTGTKQAPCRGYLDMVCISRLRSLVQTVSQCESKVALEELRKTIREARKPIATLVSTVTGLCKDLAKSLEKLQKDAKEKEGAQCEVLGSRAYGITTGLCSSNPVFEAAEKKSVVNCYDLVAENSGTLEVPVKRMVSEPIEFEKPCIWPSSSFQKSVDASPQDKLKSQLDGLLLQAQREISKGGKVRSVENTPKEIHDAMAPIMSELTPILYHARPAVPAELESYLQPQAFVTGPTTQSTPFCQANVWVPCCAWQAESAHLPTVRWHLEQSSAKKVVITSEATLMRFMRAKQAEPAGSVTSFASLWAYFKAVCSDAGCCTKAVASILSSSKPKQVKMSNALLGTFYELQTGQISTDL
eukprot:6491803-Amphidinium_carterae.5